MRLNLSKREITGVFLAPLTAIIIFTVLIGSFGLPVKELGKFVLLAIVLAYGGMFFIGLPIILALKKTDDLRLIPLSFLGGIAGLLLYPLFLYVFFWDSYSLGVGNMFFGFVEGMVVAITYGVITGIKISDAAS